MEKKMKRIEWISKLVSKLIFFSPILLSAGIVNAQQNSAPPALFLSAEEIEKQLDAATLASASAGGWSVSISPGVSVRRRSSAVKQFAIFHPWSMEIYRILEGSGEFVTGGKLVLPLADSPSEDIVRSEHGIEGGLVRKVGAGDVLVLQPGTPHWFRQIDGETITYMESRIRISTHPIQFQ
jgi:mannose-6-phosphate isomerase-like protein (cupin superfamily)